MGDLLNQNKVRGLPLPDHISRLIIKILAWLLVHVAVQFSLF
jgi:hypothetical protein